MSEEAALRKKIDEFLLITEADQFMARTGKAPTMLIIGYEAYLEFNLTYREECKRVRLPREYDEIGHVEALVVNTGPVRFIVDPTSPRRRTFLADNDFSSMSAGQHRCCEGE